jgi:hypothetical protein
VSAGGRAAPRDTGALAVLRRLAAAPAPVAAAPGEQCELCATEVAAEHRHVVDLERRTILCACRPCWLLFPEGVKTRYRAVPERHLFFPGFALPGPQWDALEIPVGLAFFFHSSPTDRVVALYPGPAGATESELPLAAWDDVVAGNPQLGQARSDVEALFVTALSGAVPRCWLVPIDRCYELVGRLRQVWRGFDGGAEARAVLADFTDDVAARSRPAERGSAR